VVAHNPICSHPGAAGVEIQEIFNRRSAMNAVKVSAIVLMVLGVLGLMYGSFSYTKDTHEAKLGPIELSVKDKETVNVPVWAGVGAIALGGVLLVFGSKKR